MPAWTREELLALASAYRPSSILNAAVELDLFTLLSRKRSTAQAVASKIRADLRGIETLLNALVAMGLLVKSGDEFGVKRDIASWLSSDGSKSMYHMAAHSAHLQRSWARLSEVVTIGQPVEPFGKEARKGATLHAFIGAMYVHGIEIAPSVVRLVDLKGVHRIIDVGGGPGAYAMAFLQRSPRIRVTLFDLPQVIPIAQGYLERAGLLKRVDLMPGDFTRDSLPVGHDLAWVSAIIHQQGREENRALFRKVRDALSPAGRIIVRDHILDKSRTKPQAAALFAVNMLVRTSRGGCFTFDEIKEDLQTAGFRKIRLVHHDVQMNGLVEGTV